MQVDRGAARFSRAHPNVRMEVLNRREGRSGLSVSDFWIDGALPGAWTSELRTQTDVEKVEPRAEVGDGCIYRITYRNPPIVDLYRRLRLPLPFPIRMQAGVITWEIVARYSDFLKVFELARAADAGFAIVSTRRGRLRTHLPLLTEAEEKLLRAAMAAGYFAVPRGISLAGLARKMNRTDPTLHESMARIERKLLATGHRRPYNSP